MESRKKILAGLVFLAILALLAGLIGTMPGVTAATTNQTNITVQVGSVTKITVSPNLINWTMVNPGSVGGLKYLDIENTGSVNISTIYGYADTIVTEPNNPIPIGSPLNYSSGGVLMLRINQTNAPYYYADRFEWNINKPTGAGGASCNNAITWGYHRNASSGYQDFLWCLTNGSVVNATGGCNSTGTTFFISGNGDNGDPSTRQPNIDGGAVSSQNGWGVFSGITSGSLGGHCIAASQDCTKILIYKYDKRSDPNFAACSDAENLRNTTLTPSSQFTINLDAWVPQGMPAGWLLPSWLTIEAGA